MGNEVAIKDVSILFIVGETASGKSALSLQLAQQFDGEIISADAMTVYEGFDIGTAKPSYNDQRVVRHHLIDVASPTESFNVAKFQHLASKAIKDISARGRLPIVVGGSGLYVDSLLYDYQFRQYGVDKNARSELDNLTVKELRYITQKKGINLNNSDSKNRRRLVRAIETEGQAPSDKVMMPGVVVLGVALERTELQQRVESRTASMVKNGLENEVKALSELYGWDVGPMKSIGYREWQDYFSGEQTLEATQAQINTHTMQLAKKQRTWFRRNKSIQWLNKKSKIVDNRTTLLNK